VCSIAICLDNAIKFPARNRHTFRAGRPGVPAAAQGCNRAP
jgi:hypothetical protein